MCKVIKDKLLAYFPWELCCLQPMLPAAPSQPRLKLSVHSYLNCLASFSSCVFNLTSSQLKRKRKPHITNTATAWKNKNPSYKNLTVLQGGKKEKKKKKIKAFVAEFVGICEVKSFPFKLNFHWDFVLWNSLQNSLSAPFVALHEKQHWSLTHLFWTKRQRRKPRSLRDTGFVLMNLIFKHNYRRCVVSFDLHEGGSPVCLAASRFRKYFPQLCIQPEHFTGREGQRSKRWSWFEEGNR